MENGKTSRIVELSLLALASVAAAASAWFSKEAITAASDLTSRQVAYQVRRDALQSYTVAVGSYDATINQIFSELEFGIDNPDEINALNRDQLAKLRLQTLPIIPARRVFRATFEAVSPVWPTHIRNLLITGEKASRSVGECFESATVKALSDEQAQILKGKINESCRDFDKHYNEFSAARTGAISDMIREVYVAAGDAGAKPEALKQITVEGPVPDNAAGLMDEQVDLQSPPQG